MLKTSSWTRPRFRPRGCITVLERLCLLDANDRECELKPAVPRDGPARRGLAYWTAFETPGVWEHPRIRGNGFQESALPRGPGPNAGSGEERRTAQDGTSRRSQPMIARRPGRAPAVGVVVHGGPRACSGPYHEDLVGPRLEAPRPEAMPGPGIAATGTGKPSTRGSHQHHPAPAARPGPEVGGQGEVLRVVGFVMAVAVPLNALRPGERRPGAEYLELKPRLTTGGRTVRGEVDQIVMRRFCPPVPASDGRRSARRPRWPVSR